MAIQIVAATAADITELSALLSVLFAQEAEFRPDTAAQERGLRAIVDSPKSGVILVARDEQGVKGMVNLLFTISTALGSEVALLEDMVVATDARGGGLGSLLLKAAIAFARQRGCKRITLLTDATNVNAQRFYERHGFSSSPMIPLRMSLA
jgi:GNAT superfamily N-acetyltransferase